MTRISDAGDALRNAVIYVPWYKFVAALGAPDRPGIEGVCPWCHKHAHARMCAPLRAVMKETT